jgi:hypothetical protein
MGGRIDGLATRMEVIRTLVNRLDRAFMSY